VTETLALPLTSHVAEAEPGELVRIAEALLFAAPEPLGAEDLAGRLPAGADIPAILADLQALYAGRGVNLVRVAGKWGFRTAPDLAFAMRPQAAEPQRLSRAAMETLAIVAYHQPVTRADIEEIRGVSTSKGSLDTLLETGWVRLRGRRKSPGRPVTYGTTPAFLEHFGLDGIGDLPGLEELKGAGLLEGRLPPDMLSPVPSDDTTLRDDEEPLDDLFEHGPMAKEADADRELDPRQYGEADAGEAEDRLDPDDDSRSAAELRQWAADGRG
jgi:segregation and condensation protein B